MRHLITVLILLSSFACADVTVRRILTEDVQSVNAGEPLRFWREVCVERDVKMVVLRTIRDLNTVPQSFIKLPSVEYGGLVADGCQAAIYQVVVPFGLTPGVYIYEPAGVLDNGKVIHLPTEKFRVIPR